MIDLTENRYSLSEAKRRELFDACVDDEAIATSSMRIITLDGGDPRSDLGRSTEQQVFDKAFGSVVPHTPELMASEYGNYEENSAFFVVLDTESKDAIASLRIIRGHPNKSIRDLRRDGLVSAKSLSDLGLDKEIVWDIATAAVVPSRSAAKMRQASTALYRALYWSSLRSGVTYWTSVIDRRVLRLYDHLGIPFQRLPGTSDFDYLGSPAQACIARLQDVESSMLSRAESSNKSTQHRIEAIIGSNPEGDLVIDLTDSNMTEASAISTQQIPNK